MGLRLIIPYVGWGAGEVYRGKGDESPKDAEMWVFIAILAIPLIEIGLFIQLGGALGLWLTLAWVIISAALGVIVLKGIASLGAVSLSRSMPELSDPHSPLAHRVMVAMAGGLLILPGFLTDTVGILLLIPPMRLLFIKLISRRLKRMQSTTVHAEIIEGEWQEAAPQESTDPQNPPSKWTNQ